MLSKLVAATAFVVVIAAAGPAVATRQSVPVDRLTVTCNAITVAVADAAIVKVATSRPEILSATWLDAGGKAEWLTDRMHPKYVTSRIDRHGQSVIEKAVRCP